MSIDAAALLRPGLLEGQVVALAGAGALGEPAGAACAALGARVERMGSFENETEDEDAAADAARALGDVDTLVVDVAGAGGDGPSGLAGALDGAWVAVRAVANAAMVPDARGGKVVLLAPGPEADTHPAELRAAVENMARTLSIEWSRYGIRTAAIVPGADTTAEEVAAVVAYLASPAGDYFSGCALELGAVRPARPGPATPS